MSNSSILSSILSDFYKSSGLDPNDLEKRVNQNLMRSYDAYILPLKLTGEERGIKSNISNILRQPVQPVNIAPFPLEHLQSVLVLKPPKKVIEYTGPTQLDLSATEQVKKEKQPRRPYGRRAGRTRLGKDTQTEVASIYAEEESTPASQAAKRQKLAEKEEETTIMEEVDYYAEEEGGPIHSTSSSLPSNFYDVCSAVFDTFWQLEFDETEVTWAFFAKINSVNCVDFKLKSFAYTSSSLAVVKEKLESKQYVSTDEFPYDFHQMFDNIFTYYPPGHPAYKKAIELSAVFDERWRLASCRLK